MSYVTRVRQGQGKGQGKGQHTTGVDQTGELD